MTEFGHVLKFLSVFVSLHLRIAFSGSECLLLSFLCALSWLLCSFPVMLCFQPLCCLVSFFFFFSPPVESFPVASRALAPFRGSSVGAAGRSGPSHTVQICISIASLFHSTHSLPPNVCMLHFHSFWLIFN